jgi:hypothetical protein
VLDERFSVLAVVDSYKVWAGAGQVKDIVSPSCHKHQGRLWKMHEAKIDPSLVL